MNLTRIRFVLVFVLFSFIGIAQTKSILNLNKQITAYNDALQYEKSIATLSGIISDENTSNYDKYYAYLLKSHTYKRLFNYTKTLEALEEAYKIGLESDKKEEVKNTILAEKSYVYFDTQEYNKAAVLMRELAKVNYKHINLDDKSWIIMQEGYLYYLDKNYSKAEHKYDEAIAILEKHRPSQLPNIYGKKIELYNKMKLYKKRDISFYTGLQFAKKHNKIKYEMYLYEVLKKTYESNNDYKNAFQTQQKFDSISKFYNSIENNGKVEIVEQKLEKEKQNLVLKNEKYVKYMLFGCIVFLIILLYFIVKLYLSNKARRILAEKENSRIYNEIEKLTKELDEKGNSKIDLSRFNLTSRQLEIIASIQNGMSNKEIANQLFISENTVKYHLKVIYEILNIEHRSEIKQQHSSQPE